LLRLERGEGRPTRVDRGGSETLFFFLLLRSAVCWCCVTRHVRSRKRQEKKRQECLLLDPCQLELDRRKKMLKLWQLSRCWWCEVGLLHHYTSLCVRVCVCGWWWWWWWGCAVLQLRLLWRPFLVLASLFLSPSLSLPLLRVCVWRYCLARCCCIQQLCP
jgi:hypothetical protein